MPVEPKRDDPGEGGIHDAKTNAFPGFYRRTFRNPAIERDGVADAARHAGFHMVAETGRDPPVFLQTPILNNPSDVAIDRYRFALIDDQRAGKPASELF
jgi:hypothetical protein